MGSGKRVRVVLDTSILLLVYDMVPVLEQVEDLLETRPECIVPRQVVDELNRIAVSKDVHRSKAAKLALQLVKLYCKVVDINAKNADEAIINLVVNDPFAIAVTADRGLRKRLRKLGKPNIYYRRSMHGLMMDGAWFL